MENKELFLETAWNIGMELVRDAIWDGNKRCNWTGNWMEPVDGQFTAVTRSFAPDLYSGTSGIAYFLLALYSLRPDAKIKSTIEGAIGQVLSKMKAVPDHGFYSGKPGVAWVLVVAGEQMDNKDWIEAGLELLADLKVTDISPYETDMISGIAGSIPVLLQLGVKYKRDNLKDSALKLGHVLITIASKEKDNWSWNTGQSTRNLTGFSHGAAGMATALLELYADTGDKIFLDAAVNGFKYEESVYDTNEKNWPDFREGMEAQPGRSIYGVSWCHGAPGIALSRLRAFILMNDAKMKEQADIAFDTTYRATLLMYSNTTYPPNFSLCHGIAGNADILLDTQNKAYIDFANSVGLLGIQRYDAPKLSWPSGTTTNKKTPGLLMGIAGTGYFYLRLYDAAKFKSVLLP